MPKPRSRVAEVLDDLRSGLLELGVGWYLFGAQAALLYGAARLTADVDVTVNLGELSMDALVQSLRKWHFEPRIDDPEFLRKTRVVPVVHVPTQFPADLVLAGPGLEELFLARAVEKDVAGVRILVARPEDIVVMKILAGRDKDRADIDAVLSAQLSTIDLTMIRETLELLEQALDQRDLMPVFEQALRRIESVTG